jgi:hypothetical protein
MAKIRIYNGSNKIVSVIMLMVNPVASVATAITDIKLKGFIHFGSAATISVKSVKNS